MKKIVAGVLCAVISLALFGCSSSGGEGDPDTFGNISITDVKTSSAESSYRIKAEMKPFTLKDFGNGLSDGLKAEWDRYRSLSPEQIMVSSRIWGLCYQKCKTWGDCIGFMGRDIYNPLEDCDWLTGASVYGMPLENDTENDHHCLVSWHGTEDGEFQHATVSVGYLVNNVKVQLRITFNGASQGTYTTGAAWASSVSFSTEELSMPNGNTALIVSPKGTFWYSSSAIYFVQNDILYHFSVTDSLGNEENVKEVTENILELFN